MRSFYHSDPTLHGEFKTAQTGFVCSRSPKRTPVRKPEDKLHAKDLFCLPFASLIFLLRVCFRYECFKYKKTINYPLLFLLLAYSIGVSIVSEICLTRNCFYKEVGYLQTVNSPTAFLSLLHFRQSSA